MLIKTKIKKVVNHILLLEKKSFFIWNQITKINFWFTTLTDNILEPFLTSPKIKDKLGNIYDNRNYLSFENDNLYHKQNNLIIFYDFFIFLVFFKNYFSQINKENSKNEKYIKEILEKSYIWFFYESKIYIFSNNKKNISFFLHSSSPVLGSSIFDIIKNIWKEKEYNLFSNTKLIKKNSETIKELLKDFETPKYLKNKCKILSFTRNKKVLEKTQEIIFADKRLDNLPEKLTDAEPNSKIKLKSDLTSSVLKIHKFDSKNKNFSKKKLFWNTKTDFWKISSAVGQRVLTLWKSYSKTSLNSKQWFWYACIYTTNEKTIFNEEKVKNSSWFNFADKKLAKTKAFVEGVERLNSWFLKSDLKDNKKLKDFDLNLIEKIIWFKIDKKFHDYKYFSKDIYKINYNKDFLEIKEKISVPVNLVYLQSKRTKKELFYKATSNGNWAWGSYKQAFFSGLMELSERDSIMITWLNKITPDLIDNNSLPISVLEKIKLLESNWNSKLFIFEVSYDKKIPHILMILKNKNWDIEVWAWARFDLKECIENALNEVLISHLYDDREKNKFRKTNKVLTVSDHKDFYCDPKHIKYLDFLFEGNKIIDYKNLKNYFDKEVANLDSLQSWFEYLKSKVKWDFYISDLTTKNSKDLGIYVVRIFSESLVPIWFWYDSKDMLPYEKDRLKINPKKIKKSEVPDFLHFFD